MHVLIHCNGGSAMGAGHVIRSLALADEALASGHDVTFAGSFDSAFVVEQLERRLVHVEPIDRGDGAALTRAIRAIKPELVHIDTYDPVAIPAGEAMRSNIEDGPFGRREADLVLDPNLGSEADARDGDHPRLLLRGTNFTPLRTAVTARRGQWRLAEDARKVLVVMGGADALDLTPRVIDALGATGLSLEVTAVSPRHEAAQRAARGTEVRFVGRVADLPGLFVSQDLVISAAGSTVWELCCLGVPMALVRTADNQQVVYERVVAAGAAAGLGAAADFEDPGDVVSRLRHLLSSPRKRERLAASAVRLVDGRGAWRVVRAWEQLFLGDLGVRTIPGLHARAANYADGDTLFRWRNDEQTRANSRDTEPIPWDRHVAWLQDTIQRQDRVLLVVSDTAGDVGTVRWDAVRRGEWEVSITLAPQRRGESLARPVLRAGERFLQDAHPDAAVVYAAVHQRNSASRRLFESSGYPLSEEADGDGFLTYCKVLGQSPPART